LNTFVPQIHSTFPEIYALLGNQHKSPDQTAGFRPKNLPGNPILRVRRNSKTHYPKTRFTPCPRTKIRQTGRKAKKIVFRVDDKPNRNNPALARKKKQPSRNWPYSAD
jgi:hypothetical protein